MSQSFLSQNKNFLLIILSLTGCILSIIQPYLSGNFIDLLISKPNLKLIIQFSIFLMIVGLLSIIVSYISNMFIVKFQTRIAFKVNFDLVQHMQKIPILKFLKYNPAYLNNRINDDSNELVSFFLSNFITIFTQAGIILFSIIILFRTNLVIFYLSLFFIPLSVVLYLLLKKPIRFVLFRYIFYIERRFLVDEIVQPV